MVYPFIKAGPGDIESMGVATDLSAMENMLVELDPSQDNTVKAYNGGIGYGILVNKPNALTGPSLVAKVQTRGIARWKTGPGRPESQRPGQSCLWRSCHQIKTR